MAAVPYIFDSGRLALLGDKSAGTLSGALARLYVTAHTPAEGDVLATYTAIEAAWTGYAAQTMSAWTSPASISGNKAQIISQLMSFTVTSGGTGVTVDGYFVTKSGVLIYAESFAVPVAVTDGTPFTLLCRFTEQNA